MAAITDEAVPLSLRIKGKAGPVTAARQRRTFLVWAVTCALGTLPVLAGATPGWQAAGFGLWFPGAGFIAVGGWAILLMPMTLLLFATALVAWFGSGMVVAPLFVWLGAASAAGAMATHAPATLSPYVVMALVGAGLACAYRRAQAQHAKHRARLDDRMRHLPTVIAEVTACAAPVPLLGERELTPEDLAQARYVLDRALQPAGQLNGFDRIEQFQTAALRYQISSAGYTLALLQCHYTPSFHGYLSQAQRNLIELYLDRRVWGYWVYESAWGHLNVTNPDPVGKDNIMLTGWFGLHVGMYMSNTGDRRYAEPGSLTFRLNRRRAFHHDIHSLVRSVVQNFQDSAFCLYPCEPNWIYPVCNHYGITSLVLYDRLFGTAYAAFNLPRWLESLDREFTDASGSLIGLRSALTGFGFPLPGGEIGFADLTNCFAPERARRTWAIARHDLQPVLKTDARGEPRFSLPGKGFDLGNYRRNYGGAYAVIMNAARELGDDDIARAAQRSLDQDCGRRDDGGILRYTRTSNLSNLLALRARIHRREDFRNAVTQGPPASVLAGPILADARYPDVLVARAFSRGDDLDLVLYPGGSPGPQKIRFERLRPHAVYSLRGSDERSMQADATGAASIDVNLQGRTALHIVPRG